MFGFGGTSNTAILGIWQTYAKAELPKDIPAYLFSYVSSAVSGDTMFVQGIQYDSLATADVIAIDQSNDYSTDAILDFEGYIRRALADGKKIIPLLIPRWTNNPPTNGEINSPTNEAAYNAQKAVCEHYGLQYADYWSYEQSVVPSTYNLSDLQSDPIHLTSMGGTKLYDLVHPKVTAAGGSLVAELNAGASDMAYPPQKIVGTSNNGTTGSWTTDGTAVYSTTADDTITFVGTFRKFGSYRTSGTNDVTVSIDGGAFTAPIASLYYGWDTGSRAEHTIVIKVVSDCRIDEFWAI